MKIIFLIIMSIILTGCKTTSNFETVVNEEVSKNYTPNPCTFNCDTNDKSSPWKFYIDFEDNSWKGKLSPNNKGMGWVPFKIIEEDDNKFLSITVKNKWNVDRGFSNTKTERSEIQTSKRQSFGKEVWYGFKIKKPKETELFYVRTLITQFKQMVKKGNVNPMVSIKQRRPNKSILGLRLCDDGYREASDYFNNVKTFSKFDMGIICNKIWYDGVYKFGNTKIFNELLNGNWNNVVIGSYITNKNDGFIIIYINNKLVFRYDGITYGWTEVAGSHIRFGIYRDDNSYPPQTLHYDDFVIGSKEDVTKVLWK